MPRDPREEFYAQKLDRLSSHPDFDRSVAEAMLHFAQTWATVERSLARLLHPHGLSVSGFNLLDILDSYDDQGLALNEIGRLMLVSRANVTGLVDSLAKRGLVERVPHPHDRRVKLARLLPPGRALLEQQRSEHLRYLSQLFSVLTPPERFKLGELMLRLRRNQHQEDDWHEEGGPEER